MRLGKNFVTYLVSSICSGALPLALMPLLTHSLAPIQYGVMVTISTMVLMVSPIVNWSTTAYASVQYFRTEPAGFATLLSSALLVPALNTLLLLGVFAVAQPLLATRFGVPGRWNLAIPLMAAAMLLPLIVQSILAMRDRAIAYAAYEIGGALINFIGTILLVLVLGLGWEGRLIAAVTASVTLSGIAAVWLIRRGFLVRRFAAVETAGAFRFGAGGVAHDLANQALRLSDRLLIVALIGQAAVGTYAVAVQWSSIMLTVLTALNRAWVPFLFSNLSKAEPGWAGRIVRQTYLVWGALVLFFVAFNVATPIGYNLLVNERYHESIGAVFWLTLGFLFNGFYVTFVDYIFYFKKTHLLAIITVSNLVLNVTLSYFLIGVFGAKGAAIAFAITAAIVMCFTFAVSNRLQPMPWLGKAAA